MNSVYSVPSTVISTVTPKERINRSVEKIYWYELQKNCRGQGTHILVMYSWGEMKEVISTFQKG
jgi:hypothetical protein